MVALALLTLSAWPVDTRAATQPSTSLVSTDLVSPQTTGRGYAPDISADGRFVAFQDGFVVLVRDLQTGTTVLASRASGPNGAEGRQPNFFPSPPPPSISADGRFVAFGSFGSNLDADDSNGLGDVFVRDLLTDATMLASRASGHRGAASNGYSQSPSISADGRLVAFESRASNLDPSDTDPPGSAEGADIFVRDLETGATTLVSRASGPAGADGNNGSTSPAISGDGRFVAFNSLASNLDPRDDNDVDDVYVRDIQAATTAVVSRDLGRIRRVAGLYAPPSLSFGGEFVAFELQGRIFVRNLATGTTRLASAGANSLSMSPSLSGDGRYVAFSSYAANLQPYLTARFPDIFVRDMGSRRTVLASRAANRFGTPANGGTHDPSISADGRFVAFEARASNLHPQDRDRSGDVFVRDLGSAPFDAQASASCGGRRATLIVLPGSWYHGTRKPWPFAGTDAPDVVVGSPTGDQLAGGSGRDRICGRGGRDRLGGGPGRDRISGGAGADTIRTADGSPDGVDCGPGRDSVVADRLDRLRGCERRVGVRR